MNYFNLFRLGQIFLLSLSWLEDGDRELVVTRNIFFQFFDLDDSVRWYVSTRSQLSKVLGALCRFMGLCQQCIAMVTHSIVYIAPRHKTITAPLVVVVNFLPWQVSRFLMTFSPWYACWFLQSFPKTPVFLMFFFQMTLSERHLCIMDV